MNEEWKITSTWTVNVDWSNEWNFIIITDEHALLDNVEAQFQESEDKTSLAKEMLAFIGVKV